jgi:hypothetical protein
MNLEYAVSNRVASELILSTVRTRQCRFPTINLDSDGYLTELDIIRLCLIFLF